MRLNQSSVLSPSVSLVTRRQRSQDGGEKINANQTFCRV